MEFNGRFTGAILGISAVRGVFEGVWNFSVTLKYVTFEWFEWQIAEGRRFSLDWICGVIRFPFGDVDNFVF